MTVAKSLKTKPPKVGDVLYAADFSGQKWRVVSIAEKQMVVELIGARKTVSVTTAQLTHRPQAAKTQAKK